MDPRWSEGEYARDVPKDFEEVRKREERNERISPYWDLLVNEQEPKINKQSFLYLMQDLKDEGNSLFKNGQYDVAWMHYRNALFIARILEMRFYHEVDKEFISTLFSNRAFCCLKKEMYHEAVQDCSSAIQIYPGNIKAYYRQVLAYKAQKKYADALKVAQTGHEKQPNVFKELVDELTEQVKKDKQPKLGKQVTGNTEEPDSDWLIGTNINVTKQSEIAKSKMPNKGKGKGKNKAGQTQTKKRQNGQVFDAEEEETEESQSDDSSDNRLSEDENFAYTFKNVRKPNLILDTNLVANVSPVFISESGFTDTPKKKNSMGLDNFSPPVKTASKSSSLSSFQSSPSTRASSSNTSQTSPTKSKSKSSIVNNEILNLVFPLENYDFKLACKQCFVKIGEGVKGYRYVSSAHPCIKDVLIIKLRDKPGINWIKLRPRPELKFPQFGGYKICQHFSMGHPCKVGEERCTFPHNKAEMDVWSLDRDGEFNVNSFVKKLQELKIDSSDHLATLKQTNTKSSLDNVDSTPVDIPGLNYKTGKNKQQQLQQLNLSTSVASVAKMPVSRSLQSPQLTEQEHMSRESPSPSLFSSYNTKPPPSSMPQFSMNNPMPPMHQQQYRPSSPFGMQRPPMQGNMPMNRSFYNYPMTSDAMSGYGYPGPYSGDFSRDHRMPPPPHMQHMMPPNMHPPGMPPFPHQNMFRNRFPGTGPPMGMPPPFSAPNAVPPVRPNLLETPVPKPLSAMQQVERMDSSEGQQTSNLIENPLIDTHTFKLLCKNCFKHDNFPGRYIYQPHQHKCEENILAMKPIHHRNSPWFRVRERKNHREFPGNYILCNSIYNEVSGFCRYGEENCSFAHSDIEQVIWTLEKDGRFNITEFIMQNRSQNFSKGFSLNEILQKHGGYFSFICKACFYSNPSMICKQGGGDHCSGRLKHQWSEYKIMAHFGPVGEVNVINARGFLHKTAFFKICKWLHFCRNRINAECRFAHSMVERDIWMLERDAIMTQEEIVLRANQQLGIQTAPSAGSRGDNQPSSAQNSTTDNTIGQIGPGLTFSSNKPVQEPVDELDDLCPYHVITICQTCWKNGKKSLQDGQKDRCVKNHANWNTNKIYLIATQNKEIRPLPRKTPSGFHFRICKYIKERNKCGYTGGGPCQFAHSQEEMEIWQWMCAHDKLKLEELYEASKEAKKIRESMVKSKIAGGESVVTVSKANVALPSNIQFSPHYCSYCGIQCNSQKQWDEHCASEKHNFNVNSDKEHQWNYRQPPWGLPGSSYELCNKHVLENKCQYSNVPDMYNLCRYAHSQEELDEWKERYEWRQMKRDMARQEKVFSFMDLLVEKFENAESGISVIAEELSGVQITCPQNLVIYEEEKNATYVWTFEVKSQYVLERVALLYNKDRLHFALQSNEMDRSCQIAQGNTFEDVDGKGLPCYRVKVQFTGTMFGSFSQWVIFDFNVEPVLVRKLSVEVGTMSTHEKIKHLRKKLHFDRWTSENREIIPFQAEHVEEMQRKLKKIYKAADSSHSVVTQHSITTELNCNNYVHKMHKLIYMEEITRHQIISSYNLCTRIELLNAIQEETYVFAHPGELFARVPLTDNLTEDTDAGKLILTSVRQVLIAPIKQGTQRVYEASIVRKDNFDYDGRGKEYIYLCLSPDCVNNLQLQKGVAIEVEIQFQMDRLWFCMMHYAIDCLKTTDVVFPNVSKINPQWNEKRTLKVSSNILNPDQIQAVQHIVSERTGYTPPFVIYGPFGTGKTETLAQAAMTLLKERPEAKILICAQSNSAADLYITKHLDPFLRKGIVGTKLRRVYFRERRVNTVATEVKRYCLLTADKTAFEVPSLEDIKNHNIVIVTLGTSLVLTELGLQGHFTHIFIDEAAQAFEAETVLPLSLATEKTCVVLAGDHQQMGPKVYSSEARDQKFGMSLLERLYLYYDSFSNKIDQSNPVNILLRINYRSKMEILRFISAIFYGGPDKLVSEANLPSVVEITPLMFYAVQGVEVQDSDSVSYYNMSEVQEIVERVEELYTNWPHEWGTKHAKDIGVVTPYYDQVLLIRKALRKRHPELRTVTVERVNNVQGKEFRALFISTVRTRSLIDLPNVPTEDSECDGDGGNFGFLSEPKLLNTALTRAQSFVAVVGDPVALCAIGECLTIWRTYLKHCQNMKSIQPRSLTLESVRQQVYNLLNSPARERLLEISNQTKQSSHKVDVVPALSEEEVQDNISMSVSSNLPINQVSQPKPLNGDAFYVSQPKPLNGDAVFVSQPKPLNGDALFNSLRHITSDLDNFEIDCVIQPDDIIKHLAKEEAQSYKMKKLEEAALADGGIFSKEMMMEFDEPVNIDNIKVKVVEGHALVSYKDEDLQKKSKLMSADNIDDDLQFGTDPSDVESDVYFTNYREQQLWDFVKHKSDFYKHCIIHMQSSVNMYAEVLDPNCPYREIQLSNRSKCGQAFDNDEVVVEILPHDENLNVEENAVTVYGSVIGILKRFNDLQYKCFVCMVDPENTGLMVPINRGIPKIYNLVTKYHLQRAKKGHVCVYQFTKEKELEFSQLVKVDSANPEAKLFIVRYLKWDAKLLFPFGVVVGVIDAGTNIEKGMRILEIEHQLPKKYHQEVVTEINIKYPPTFKLPQDVYKSHEDMRERWTFTVDGPACEDIENALSIEELNDGNYLIGVHVSDVSYFVRRGVIDDEARSRGLSMYPLGREAINMLPSRLSTDLCSLKPGHDRLTISIFMTVSKSGDIIHVQPKRCIINSKKKFTYQEVEDILHDPNAATDYLKSCVLVLYHICRIWRKERLGNASMYSDLDTEDKVTPEAHLMVQELAAITNHRVAKILIEKYPETTPLYCQQPPNSHAADEWKSHHTADAAVSVALTKPYLEGSNTCKCKVACACIINYLKGRNIELRRFFDIFSVLWDHICQSLDIGDGNFIQSIVLAAETHPHLALALANLKAIQDRPVYMCSGDITSGSSGHYNLNLAPYTHFTSPVRRYIDIIVHRMINGVIDNYPSSYSKYEIQSICREVTNRESKYQQFKSAVHAFLLASALKSRPLVVHPVIENVDDKGFKLYFPTVKDIPEDKRRIDHDLLQPSEKPIFNQGDLSIQLKWQERIYDPEISPQQQMSATMAVLNPDRFICKIPAFHWQKMLIAIREENSEKLLTAVNTARQMVKDPNADTAFVKEVPAEVRVNDKIQHFTAFTTNFRPCSVVQVQISASMYKGMLTPVVQIINLAQNLDMCIEHRDDPVNCFSSSNLTNASRPNYADEKSYQNAWLPVIDMEAAHSCIKEGESILIHNVMMEWKKDAISDVILYTAVFSLPVDFCKERHIKFSDDINFDDLFEPSNIKLRESYFLDYICVRYSGLQLPDDPSLNESIALLVNNGSPVTWVGHCVVMSVNKNNKNLIVKIRLHQNNVMFPVQLLHSTVPCTIEWITKTVPHRTLDYAVRSLTESSRLACDIARGRNPVPIAVNTDIDKIRQFFTPGIAIPNINQDMAIRTALKQPFTLIEGGPGTGKSVTGVHIAYLLSQINKSNSKSSSSKPQVLYCGPSNKSVDVIAGFLKNITNMCPKIIRVYAEAVEQQEFPLPNTIPAENSNIGVDCIVPEYRDIALHHIIRQSSNTFSTRINEYDMLFRMYPDDISDDQINEYKDIVTLAEMQEIKNADVILCTCVASASHKLSQNTNIEQIIIDECGMCTEPESMVPIILYPNVKRIVLIGDVKSLSPVILEQKARDLGLGRSLFERYSENAVSLTYQYRMHEGIAEFPSGYFYNGILETDRVEQKESSTLNIWPNSPNKPVVFCHIEGKEETQIITTDHGNAQSKCNMDEVNLVVAVVSRLVSRHQVAEKSIVILTPYSSQCTSITKSLNQKGYRNINISTVLASQGREWDYVILTTVRSMSKSKIEKKPTNGWKHRNVGEVADNNQMNVALTRARKGLIIIGNQNLLRCEDMWSKLLAVYKKDGKIMNSSDFVRLLG